MGIRVRLRCVAAIGAAASVGAFLLPVAMVRADGQNVATAAPAGTAGNEPPDSRAPDPRASDSRSIAEAALATLEREAARLRNAGDGATADAMEKQVRLFRDRLSGKGRAEGDGPELHVVGVYEGPAAGGVRRGFREHPVGAASVEVGVTDRPVVLALCAYEPVKWSVKVADGATLQRVILGGYSDQQVEGVPPAVPVEKGAPQPGVAVKTFLAYAKDQEHYPGACRQLKQLTGLDVSTFQGEYRAPDRAFVVGPENPEWVAQRVLSDLRPLYLPAAASDRAAQQQSMRDLRFWAVLHSFPNIPGLPPEAARHQGLFTLAEFTIGGPVAGTTVALPRDVNGVATDPHGPTHYGLSREGVVRLDIQAGQVEQIAWDPAVGRPGWPLGITFDTKRGRVVVSTLDRGGRLYAYDVAGKKWSLLAEQRGLPIASLAYAPAEDVFYGLATGGDRPVKPVVQRFDGEGKATGRVVLDRRIPTHPHDRPDGGPQIWVVGDYLAVLTPPVVDVEIDPTGPAEPRCYLFEKTGKLVYSGPLRPQPPSRAQPIAAAEMDDLWGALRDADDAAADKLMWRLASGGEAAVQYLRDKLAPAGTPDERRVDALVAKLSEEDAAARDDAAAELRQGGAAAKAGLTRALGQDPAPETRARAGAVLDRIRSDEKAAADPDADRPRPPQDPQARARWMRDFDAGFIRLPVPGARWDDDPRLRRDRRGMIVLSRIGSPAAVDCLRQLAAGTPGAPRTVQAKAAMNAPQSLPLPSPQEPGGPRP